MIFNFISCPLSEYVLLIALLGRVEDVMPLSDLLDAIVPSSQSKELSSKKLSKQRVVKQKVVTNTSCTPFVFYLGHQTNSM